MTDRKAAQQTVSPGIDYRLIADNITDVIVWYRGDEIVWVSPSVEDAFGKPPEHWVGRSVTGILAATSPAVLLGNMNTNSTGGQLDGRIRHCRISLCDAHDKPHWVDVRAKTFYDNNGVPNGRIATLRLIDGPRKAHRAAERARSQAANLDSRYRQLMDNSCIPTNLITPEGAFLLTNQAMCDFVGYDAHTLLGMTWQNVVDHRSWSEWRRAIQALVAGRQDSYRTIRKFLHANGSRLWGDLSLSCVRQPGGEVECLVAQIVDVTHDILAGQSAIRSQRLIETSTVGTALGRIDGRLIAVNPAMRARFGATADGTSGAILERSDCRQIQCTQSACGG
jgi:PAS domain S-box-containing protein